MDFQAFSKQLSDLEARYLAWAEPIDQALETLSYRINRDGYSVDDYERDIDRIRDEQLAQYDPNAEMNAFFDEVCPTYLRATDRERAELRAAVRDKAGILSGLLGYVYHSATQLRDGAGAPALRRGLAAASLEDCSRDFRDTSLALAELFVAAEEAGIDPRPEFQRVAQLSSRGVPPGNTAPTASVLSDFHTYAVVKERRKTGGYCQGG